MLDGLGYVINKVGTLWSTFGQTRDYWLDEIDGAESNAWYNFAVEKEAFKYGTGVTIEGKGYVQQELDRLKQLKAKP